MPLDYSKVKRYSHLTPEQVRRHFEVERELARKIMAAPRQERSSIALWAYDELFRQIPWHPALTEESGAAAPDVIAKKTRDFMALLPPPPANILEIGCGMGELSIGLAQKGFNCTGIDISTIRIQRLQEIKIPGLAFEQADALSLPFPEKSFHAVISMQLFEHLHPEDASVHLREVWRVLKDNGCYLLETPNRLVGPGDVSRFFVDGAAQGFHLKEYTVAEMVHLLHRNLFSHVEVILKRSRRVSEGQAIMMEKLWSVLPKKLRQQRHLGLHNPIYRAWKRGRAEK